jgi:hypothetical protein
MTTVAHLPKKGYRTIRLPLAESEYGRFLTDRSYAKDRLEELYEECAELFPDAFPSGYAFFGYTESSMKQQLLCRRIRLDQGGCIGKKGATYAACFRDLMNDWGVSCVWASTDR